MLKINIIQEDDFVYYEALFNGGNLYAFFLFDLLLQLMIIYEIKPKTLFYEELKFKNEML